MRSHSEDHKRHLRLASARLLEERDVGRALRRTNPALFETLLASVRAGSTRLMEDVCDVVEREYATGRLGARSNQQAPSPGEVSRAPIAHQQPTSTPPTPIRPPLKPFDIR